MDMSRTPPRLPLDGFSQMIIPVWMYVEKTEAAADSEFVRITAKLSFTTLNGINTKVNTQFECPVRMYEDFMEFTEVPGFTDRPEVLIEIREDGFVFGKIQLLRPDWWELQAV